MKYLNKELAASLLLKRPNDAHKGDFGRLLIVAGSPGLTGAAIMTTRTAVRSGAGLTYLSTADELCNAAVLTCPEAMVFPYGNLDKVLQRLEACDVCVIGPGLGRSEAAEILVLEVMRHSKCPLIIDADGINILSQHIDILSECKSQIIVTPHEGEFARLAPTLIGTRVERALLLAKAYRITVVLKGFGTVIAFPNGDVYVNTTGNPGMAKGGSGDVLAGAVGALIGQFGVVSGTLLGVFLHGFAGDIASKKKSEYSMIASDIIETLPEAFLEVVNFRDYNIM